MSKYARRKKNKASSSSSKRPTYPQYRVSKRYQKLGRQLRQYKPVFAKLCSRSIDDSARSRLVQALPNRVFCLIIELLRIITHQPPFLKAYLRHKLRKKQALQSVIKNSLTKKLIAGGKRHVKKKKHLFQSSQSGGVLFTAIASAVLPLIASAIGAALSK